MLKKFVVGGLFLALVGVLVAGAINRTLDKSDSSSKTNGRINESASIGQRKGNTMLVNSTESNYDIDPLQSSLVSGNRRQGLRNRDQLSDVNPGTGKAEVDEWLTLSGVVTMVDADALMAEVGGGQSITIENRPWWFARDQGFSISIGDEILLEGFYESDTFEVGQLTNLSTDASVQIRLETGRPLWVGGGSPNIPS